MFSKRLMKRLATLTKLYARLDQQGWLTGSDLLQEVLIHLVKLSQDGEQSEAILLNFAKYRAIDVVRNAKLKPLVEPLPNEDLEEGWVMAGPEVNQDLKLDFARAMNTLTPEERLLLPLMATFSQREQSQLAHMPRRHVTMLHQSIRAKLRRAGLCRYIQTPETQSQLELDEDVNP